MYHSTYVNRTFCDILTELRKCHETSNFSYMLGLIEELQTLGNRMESNLEYKNSYNEMRDELKKLSKEINELELKKEKLKCNQDKK